MLNKYVSKQYVRNQAVIQVVGFKMFRKGVVALTAASVQSVRIGGDTQAVLSQQMKRDVVHSHGVHEDGVCLSLCVPDCIIDTPCEPCAACVWKAWYTLTNTIQF